MIRRSLLISMLFTIGAIPVFAQAPLSHSDKARLVGAWHLVSINGPGGKPVAGPLPKGMLVYTADGHVSVQLMYQTTSLSNEYVEQGYEASFGSYELHEATHTVMHHIIGANTRVRLVGKDLPRLYRLTKDGRLIIRSANPDEHWSVTWRHY